VSMCIGVTAAALVEDHLYARLWAGCGLPSDGIRAPVKRSAQRHADIHHDFERTEFPTVRTPQSPQKRRSRSQRAHSRS
jgi:hypothetical protein